MKVVLDTNILISALVFGGKPRTIFELIVKEKAIIGVTSPVLIAELLGVLKEKFAYSSIELTKIYELIIENFVIVAPKNIPKTIKEDSFDNQVLAIADEVNVAYIISGDNHLLKLQRYKNTPITPPHCFVDRILKYKE